MNTQPVKFAPVPRPPTATSQPEVFRRSIDKIATLRARNVRVGYYGMVLHRPDPDGNTTPEDRDCYLDILTEEVTIMSRICALLETAAPVPDIPEDIRIWIHKIAIRKPDKLARVVRVCRMAEEILAAVKSNAADLGQRLIAHQVESREGFFDLITHLCEGLWHVHGMNQKDDLEQATNAAVALAGRLERLERIGKHVRLVSLNASVEAARAGDVGKGLMVIAQEFKTLAEEIQTLAKDARGDVAEIS